MVLYHSNIKPCPFVRGMSTGITDKKGKEIFFGDIIRVGFIGQTSGEVFYLVGEVYWCDSWIGIYLDQETLVPKKYGGVSSPVKNMVYVKSMPLHRRVAGTIELLKSFSDQDNKIVDTSINN